LQACDITKRGLKYDREFMVVDDKGKFVSQRTKPRMALIETSIDWQRDVLTLKAPGAPTMQIHLRESDPAAEKSTFDVNVWGDHCDAFEVSEECSCWFNIVLECTNLRLVRMQPTFVRETDIDYAPEGQVRAFKCPIFLLKHTYAYTHIYSHMYICACICVYILYVCAYIPYRESYRDMMEA
jgi:uncharacterized protein YcbX